MDTTKIICTVIYAIIIAATLAMVGNVGQYIDMASAIIVVVVGVLFALARWCQTNRLKHHKPWERAFYEAIRDRHSVRAASRFSLKVLRFESDLCAFK